ncbi:cobalt-precorrin-6A reductase [Alkaliphilus hydrothermalis]|uniref:Precorrin-6A/cobalt-precorrin-6A reductase n=1 Tax=Alkaliphilus hydrothermalis TaxID=1482730 RepID=A0ABS2NP63_9FIRM|nr:cobalt-precorrin-6A reductase [Alkaliphilus hydrothermalis]MBM7614730.1 precorrin-6A/cobalt-precorrin-6A reductase [Alkaliphilus hydrothermalis]
MILALCGTSEGRELLGVLAGEYPAILATVTTPYGVECLGDYPTVEVLQTKLQQEEFEKLIEERQIQVVVDISHPYAEKISTLAINVCREKKIHYLRYERRTTEQLQEDPNILWVEDFPEAVQLAKGFVGRIFLTIGSNHLTTFVKEIPKERLLARVLPVSKVLLSCEELGLNPDNIIAMKGPFSEEMNRAMFAMQDVSVVVTKDSGGAGGTLDKLRAAKAVGIPVIVIKRPAVDYGEVYYDLKELMNTLKILKEEKVSMKLDNV